MPHTAPDWSSFGKQSTVFPVFDLGELAVRLGSINSFNRSGNVLFLDNFEESLVKWDTAPSGQDAAVALSVAHARNGAHSVKLTAGSTTEWYSLITRQLPYPVVSKMGVEVSLAGAQDYGYLNLELYSYDGVRQYGYGLRYRFEQDDLAVLIGAADYKIVQTDLRLRADDNLFHTFKLVVDLAANEYARAVVDSHTEDLSGIDPYDAGASGLVHLDVYIYWVGRDGENDIAYLDDVIVTQNEE